MNCVRIDYNVMIFNCWELIVAAGNFVWFWSSGKGDGRLENAKWRFDRLRFLTATVGFVLLAPRDVQLSAAVSATDCLKSRPLARQPLC